MSEEHLTSVFTRMRKRLQRLAMHHAMTHVQQVEPMVTVEEQLGDMFKMID